MRSITPRPLLLAFVLLLVFGAIAVIELGSGVAGPAETPASDDAPAAAPGADRAGVSEERRDESAGLSRAPGPATPQNARIGRKEAEFRRAEELVAPAGFINADSVSINAARGEKVILVDFWTYSCYNCQNTQPYLNGWHEKYSSKGLLVLGVHTPEFGFERNPENVEQAVREAGIEYPVVLDNDYATWTAYDQRYWPTMYLVDADGFIRYRHFGEGAYEQTEAKIRELLAEKDRTSS